MNKKLSSFIFGTALFLMMVCLMFTSIELGNLLYPRIRSLFPYKHKPVVTYQERTDCNVAKESCLVATIDVLEPGQSAEIEADVVVDPKTHTYVIKSKKGDVFVGNREVVVVHDKSE